MLEWLQSSFEESAKLDAQTLWLRLSVALGLGFVVAVIYFLSQRRPRTEVAPFVTTLVLMTVVIAMVSMVIGSNVARAFSLVGALSIVRFRTVVDDSRDTAFVIFAVVVGMAVGTGNLSVALIGIPIVAFGTFLLFIWSRSPQVVTPTHRLELRVPLCSDAEGLLRDSFAQHVTSARLISTATSRQGTALDLRYLVQLKEPTALVSLVVALNRLEGVQDVEVRDP